MFAYSIDVLLVQRECLCVYENITNLKIMNKVLSLGAIELQCIVQHIVATTE